MLSAVTVVEFMPAPWSVIDFEIITPVAQINVPGGSVIVSPF
jgi:hypothetical protein